MARRRRSVDLSFVNICHVTWRPIPLTDDWFADLWDLQRFGGLQLTSEQRLRIALS